MTVPSASEVNTLRRDSSTRRPSLVIGGFASHSFLPSDTNLYPEGLVLSGTGLYTRNPRIIALNPGSEKPLVTTRFERSGRSVPVCEVIRLSASGTDVPSANDAR